MYKNVYYLEQNNHIQLNKKQKIVSVNASTTICELNNFLIRKGFFLFINPGAKNVTVGGAISSDIHGKNHEKFGSFGNYVKEITIQTSSGKILKCNNKTKKDLFYSAIGGMGLIGIIINAKIYVRKIQSTIIKQKCFVYNYNINDFKFYFDKKAEYKICWLNLNKKKTKAVMLLGDHLKKKNVYTPLKENFLKRKILDFINIKVINFFYPIFKSLRFSFL